MKNNKGFTVVELVMSFVIVSILVIGMLKMALTYQEKVNSSEARLALENYKNTVTKDIEDDINQYGVNNVSNCGTNCIKLDFLNGSSKNIQIEGNSIIYDGQKYTLDDANGTLETIKEPEIKTIENNKNIFIITIPIKNNELEQLKIKLVGMTNVK